MDHIESYSVSTNTSRDETSKLYVLFAGESQTKPAHVLGPKVYDYYLIHLILSGNGTFQYQGREVQLTAGDSFIIEPEQLVSYRSDNQTPWRYCWIAFRGDAASSLLLELKSSAHYPVLQADNWQMFHTWYHRIQQSLQAKSSALHFETVGYLHLLIATHLRYITPLPDKLELDVTRQEFIVQQAIHYVSTQYAENITIEHMAQHLGYNRAYLSRIFKQHTSVSPVTFLLKFRVDKARLLMRERPELTLEQIASSAGFQDPLYFSKQFRRFYEMSPSRYRIQLQRTQAK
jgi:AraC-like DNA-binding protein/mannose-6-phosphate isomerase-like protein (cupin superfamily)